MMQNSSFAQLQQENDRLKAELAQLRQENDRLRESEERYRTLFELSNEGIYRFELQPPVSVSLPIDEQVDLIYQNYRYVEVNNAFVSMLGLECATDANGKSFADFFKSLETNREGVRAAVINGYQIRNAEAEEVDGNGQRRYVLWNTVSEVRDGYIQGGWGTQTDITELKQAQQALLQAEQNRVAELAKTNQALKNSLDRLAADPDLNAFLGHVLLEISQQLQIDLGYLFFYDPNAQTLELHMRVTPEAALLNHELEENDPFSNPFSIVNLQIWDTLLQTRKPFLITRDNAAQYVFRGTLEWQEQNQHHQAGINLLLTLRDEPIGLLALVSTRRGFTPEELELAQALAQQATLAIQLTRLAEEAKQAAIAREKEKAALERVADLAKANESLRSCVNKLADEPNPEILLEHILLEASAQIESYTAALFLYDKSSNTRSMKRYIRQGQVLPIETTPSLELFRKPVPGDIVSFWEEALFRGKAVFFNLDECDKKICPRLDWHFSQGHRSIVRVPLILGSRPLGFIGFCFREPRSNLPSNIELVMALAQQATLALHLMQLAEEAQQAAILEERNRMAREIHDTLAQTFTGVIVQLEAAKDLLVSRPDIVQNRLNLAADLARQGLSEARRSVRALRLEALESGSLLEALQRLIHQMTDTIPIQTSVSLEGTPRPLPGDVEENLLRIAQESLTNALRHANPQIIKIELIFETDTFYLRISDDGEGFDPQVFQASSFGLFGIQERARRIGGQFDLTSKPNRGTAITITLPIV